MSATSDDAAAAWRVVGLGLVTRSPSMITDKISAKMPSPLDPEIAVAHLRAADPVLARLIDRVGPFAINRAHDGPIFDTLLRSIVYQQLSGKAAAAILGRVHGLFRGGVTPEKILRASDEKLRGAGLSRSKVLAARDLARRTKAGELPTLEQIRLMEDEAIVESLTTVRGIGRWTAEMLLIFRLGRPDVLPVDDYGVRKGFALAFKKRTLPTREQLAKHGARWKPYRSVASWYLWRALDPAPIAKPPPRAEARS